MHCRHVLQFNHFVKILKFHTALYLINNIIDMHKVIFEKGIEKGSGESFLFI